MPDENRFAGIGQAVEGDGPDDDATDAGSAGGGAVADGSSGAGADTPEDDPDRGSSDDGSDTVPDAESSDDGGDEDEADDPAAFAFDDTVQKSVYVRPETYETLEDAEALVNARLRTEHGVKDLTRREFFDAVFREAADDTDRLVERIRRMREE